MVFYRIEKDCIWGNEGYDICNFCRARRLLDGEEHSTSLKSEVSMGAVKKYLSITAMPCMTAPPKAEIPCETNVAVQIR